MMSAQAETWRVSTPEGVFETDLETLKQWIIEGCVLPTDKVCKGTLSWIEAGRAPMLRSAFAGEVPTANPTPNATVTSDANASTTAELSSPNEVVPTALTPAQPAATASSPHVCHNHAQTA